MISARRLGSLSACSLLLLGLAVGVAGCGGSASPSKESSGSSGSSDASGLVVFAHGMVLQEITGRFQDGLDIDGLWGFGAEALG